MAMIKTLAEAGSISEAAHLVQERTKEGLHHIGTLLESIRNIYEEYYEVFAIAEIGIVCEVGIYEEERDNFQLLAQSMFGPRDVCQHLAKDLAKTLENS